MKTFKALFQFAVRTALVTLAGIAIVSAIMGASPAQAPLPQPIYRATVVRVLDGDTVHVDVELGLGVWLRDKPVRLAGVHALELTGEQKVQAQIEKEALAQLLPVATECVLDLRGVGKDKYGRILGVLYNQHATNVNEVMKGYAQGGRAPEK